MINNERLLKDFLEYVQIDSESTHEAAFAARVAEDLKAGAFKMLEKACKDESRTVDLGRFDEDLVEVLGDGDDLH